MRLNSYRYWDEDAGWDFSRAEFQRINLVVGDTGTGKSRFLNTIFNLGAIAVGIRRIRTGSWDTAFESEGTEYRWILESKRLGPKLSIIANEKLWRKDKNDHDKIIVDRTETSFEFFGNQTPKLRKDSPSISLLREEDAIKPIYNGFQKIIRRDFSADALGQSTGYESTAFELIDGIEKIEQLFGMQLGVNSILLVLSKKFPTVYEAICENYKEVFSFIHGTKMMELKDIDPHFQGSGRWPVFAIKEKDVNKWLPITECSSGMKKVLLLIVDTYTMPEGGVYLIDEYENSLGINAINFLPDFLSTHERDLQFIMTSHHPYIINNMPVENWLIFHRKGGKVKIRYGKDNVEKFSRSKQQRFVQLLNDPFYAEGVE